MSEIERLIQITRDLRAPDGCPWDKEQTFKSLTPYIIEEAYELVDGLEQENFDLIREELGDALLHVIMLSNMAEEKGLFSVYDVAKYEADKMIHRHPHVFGDKKADSVDDVWKHWEAQKQKEKKPDESAMDSIPKHFPALLQAYKVQKRASRLGFDWKTSEGMLKKLPEEIGEFIETIEKNEPEERVIDEAGDILFALVNVLRFYKVNPEEALRKSNQKFISRFKDMETSLKEKNKAFTDFDLEGLDVLWDAAKAKEKNS